MTEIKHIKHTKNTRDKTQKTLFLLNKIVSYKGSISLNATIFIFSRIMIGILYRLIY